MDLRDKVVVVTGGGSRIGAAMARRFATEVEHAVVVADLHQARAAQVATDPGDAPYTLSKHAAVAFADRKKPRRRDADPRHRRSTRGLDRRAKGAVESRRRRTGLQQRKLMYDEYGVPVSAGKGIATLAERARILAELEPRSVVVREGAVERIGKRTGGGRPAERLLVGFVRCAECGAAAVRVLGSSIRARRPITSAVQRSRARGGVAARTSRRATLKTRSSLGFGRDWPPLSPATR